jgi:hypothetical protein
MAGLMVPWKLRLWFGLAIVPPDNLVIEDFFLKTSAIFFPTTDWLSPPCLFGGFRDLIFEVTIQMIFQMQIEG